MERDQQPGWLASVQRLAETLLSILRNRCDLIGLELQEEKQRVVSILICAAITIFFGFVAVIVITLTVVFLVRPESRGYALLGFSVFYVMVGLWAGLSLKKKLHGPPPFAESVNELKKDIAALRPRP